MRNVYTVKQVNLYIKNMFAQDFMLNRIYVKGEVSNCKYHTSGHIYFSLKDEQERLPVLCSQDREMDSDSVCRMDSPLSYLEASQLTKETVNISFMQNRSF